MSSQFFKVTTVDTTLSTNTDLIKRAEEGQEEGFVLQALEQTGGKGRHGRVWDSPKGNLHASILLRPRCTAQEACYYSFVAALAVFDAVAALRGDVDLQLKWPNDVLVDGKKISGILIDTAPVEKGMIEWLVIGIGVNVAACPEKPSYPATSLACEGAAGLEVSALLEALLETLDRWRLTLKHDGFGPVRRAWLSDAKRGALSVKMPSGIIEGQFGGLDSTGGLILRLADGTERVIQAGDVFFS